MTYDEFEVIYYDYFKEYVNDKMMIYATNFAEFWRYKKSCTVMDLLEDELDDISKDYLQNIIDFVEEKSLSYVEFVTYLIRQELIIIKIAECWDKPILDDLYRVETRKRQHEQYEELLTKHLLMKLFYYMCNVYNINPNIILDSSSTSHDALQELVNNSYDEAIVKIINNLQSIYVPLTAQDKIDIDKIKEEILLNKSMLSDVFLNHKKSAKIKSGHHFLSKLMQDSIAYSDDGKLYFASFFRGIVDGYTEKAIKLSVDTQKALKELEQDREVFVKHHDAEKIKFIDSMIEFFVKNKNANYIPFKVIGSTMGMSKNEARNFAKYIINLNENSFDRDFEQQSRFPFEYNTVVKDNKNI